MDASFVPIKTGTNEALTDTHILTQTFSSDTQNQTEIPYNRSVENVVKPLNIDTKHVRVSTEYIKHDNQTKLSEYTVQDSKTTQQQQALSNVAVAANPFLPTSIVQSVHPNSFIKEACLKNNDRDPRENNNTDISSHTNTCSMRSVSSPQLTTKPLTRSKVYRKASLKSTMSTSYSNSEHSSLSNDHKVKNLSSEVRIINISNSNLLNDHNTKKQAPISHTTAKDVDNKDTEGNNETDESKNKWNIEDIHITCNPLSTPYPYSTPLHKTASETVMEQTEEEPKGRSCGNFLPILSLIPQTVISFQYLSPKMKFSWWRNKIS